VHQDGSSRQFWRDAYGQVTNVFDTRLASVDLYYNNQGLC